MSQNAASPRRGVANELNGTHQDEDIRAQSPAIGEEDEGSDDDRQALLSSSSRVVRDDGDPSFKPVGAQQRREEFTHVSNWLYMKGILVEVITQIYLTKMKSCT